MSAVCLAAMAGSFMVGIGCVIVALWAAERVCDHLDGAGARGDRP